MLQDSTPTRPTPLDIDLLMHDFPDDQRVTMICVGDELLDGSVRDLNLVHLGELLTDCGARLDSAEWVRDSIPAIAEAIARATTPTVVVSGGLGPTADDITRDAAAQWCGRDLVLDEESLETLQQLFASVSYPFTDNNRRQAFFPKDAQILSNPRGTAPGFIVEFEGTRAFFFPGVPSEFRAFSTAYVVPLFQGTLLRRRLYFHGLGESRLESRLEGLVELAAEHAVSVGYRADYPVTEVKLTAADHNALEEVTSFVVERVGTWGIGQDKVGIAERLGELLLENKATVTTAESCTAGGIAAAITDVAGSSAWFEQGYVTYANTAKIALVDVRPETLEAHGAVSAQTVCQMAAGAQKRAGADYALAVSGVAGPGGGTPEKPVGTVHFGLATPEGIYHRRIQFRLRDRKLIRSGTVYSALAMLIWRLDGRLDKHEVRGPFSPDDVMRPEGIHT